MASSTPTSFITTTTSAATFTSSSIVSSVPAAVSVGTFPINQRRFSSAARLFTTDSNTSPSSSNSSSNSLSKSLDLSHLQASTDVSSIVESSSLLDSTHVSSGLIDSYSNLSFLSPVSSSPPPFSCANTTTTISNGSPDPLSQLAVDPLSQLVVHLLSSQPKNLTEVEENPSFVPTTMPPSSISSLLTDDPIIASSPPVAPPSLPSSSALESSSSSLNATIVTSNDHQLPSPALANSPSSADEILSSEEIASVPLWKKKSSTADPSHSQCDFEVDPVNLQKILIYLVTKVDGLSAKYEELDSKHNIMHNSLLNTLDKDCERKFDKLRTDFLGKYDDLDGESTINQCRLICENLKNELDEKLGDVLTGNVGFNGTLNTCKTLCENLEKDFNEKFEGVLRDNEETRKVWDLHMGKIRARVHDRDDDDLVSSDDESDNEVPINRTNIHRLSAAVDKLTKENLNLDRRLVQIEQYTRRESLVFSGVPGSITQENLESFMIQVMFHLGFKHLRPDDIVACHRLWSPPNSREPSRVIIRFCNRKIVEWSLAHPENLKHVKEAMGLDLSMTEHICDKNMESLNICNWLKEKKQIFHHFTRNGFSKVVIKKGDRPVKVTHPADLRYKFVDIPDILPLT